MIKVSGWGRFLFSLQPSVCLSVCEQGAVFSFGICIPGVKHFSEDVSVDPPFDLDPVT